jgi:hypothetical protein
MGRFVSTCFPKFLKKSETSQPKYRSEFNETTKNQQISKGESMHSGDIIPLFAIVFFFSSVAYVIHQVLQHRQRMKMIDKGVTQLELPKAQARSDQSLKYGLVAIALGLAIFQAQIFEANNVLTGGEMVLGLVPLYVGIALLIAAWLERRREKNNPAA